MELKDLKSGAATAAAEAKKLVADANDGRSPFAAAIRSNFDHANELIAAHEKWLAANPAPKPAAK
jgi:hypothetical protein